MNLVGSIKTADIGRFRSMGDVKLYKKMKSLQDQVEGLRDRFIERDNLSGDHNSNREMVLLEESGLAGFLDNTQGELDAATFKLKKRVVWPERGNTYGVPVRLREATDITRNSLKRSEDDETTRWQREISVSYDGGPYKPTESGLVVENKAEGTLSYYISK